MPGSLRLESQLSNQEAHIESIKGPHGSSKLPAARSQCAQEVEVRTYSKVSGEMWEEILLSGHLLEESSASVLSEQRTLRRPVEPSLSQTLDGLKKHPWRLLGHSSVRPETSTARLTPRLGTPAGHRAWEVWMEAGHGHAPIPSVVPFIPPALHRQCCSKNRNARSGLPALGTCNKAGVCRAAIITQDNLLAPI